jgi:hypothetical protein
MVSRRESVSGCEAGLAAWQLLAAGDVYTSDPIEGVLVMWISKRALVTACAAVIGALSMAFAGGAFGAPGKGHPSHPNQGQRTGAPLIDESLAPSQTTDPVFHGVSPGNAPWVLKRGDVRLKRDGKLDLELKGLVIPALGTPGPVTTVSASLYCGADSSTKAVDTTQQVSISRKGNARIRDRSFSVPATCLAPVILVQPNGLTTAYIALDGWRL